MNAGLPSPAFRESYRWRATAVSVAPHRSVFNPDGRVHPSRARYEFYPTPPEATRALLSVEQFDGPVWEPACGQGHISKVPIDAGLEVVSTDLIQRDFGIGGRDFLSTTASPAKHIVTNPPYGRGLGDAFVHHALRLVRETGGTVAMLLNLASLAHPSRHELWTSHPPTAVMYSTSSTAGPRAMHLAQHGSLAPIAIAGLSGELVKPKPNSAGSRLRHSQPAAKQLAMR